MACTSKGQLEAKVRGNRTCCVPGCKSIYNRNKDLSYHKFPKDGEKITVTNEYGYSEVADRRKIWEIKLKMGKRPSNSMTVCSLHFKKEDFERSGWSSQQRLRADAVPSHLPLTNKKREKSLVIARQERCYKRSQQVRKEMELSNATNAEDAANGLLLLRGGIHDQNTKKTFCDQSTQVNLGVYQECGTEANTAETAAISDFVKTDEQLNNLTGIHSLTLLNSIVDLVRSFKKDKRVHRLSIYKRIFLVFMKFKLDLPYVVLSVLFNVSAETCKNIFFENCLALSEILKNVIYFPSAEEIRRNLPKCFEDFQNVRVVLDCTEIPVRRHSKRLCCRDKSTTIKFMTGTSPAGIITHVSPAYGDRASDSAVFENSDVMDQLQPFVDAVMVDRGYLIEKLCEDHGIKLIRFSHIEAVSNAKIAAARVHIERTNQRIKLFRILTNQLPVSLVPIIEDVFVIACAIVNLSAPILADDKFFV